MVNRFPSPEEGTGKTRSRKAFDKIKEAEEALYKTDKGVIHLPANHFEASMRAAATEFKYQGKKTYKEVFAREILVEPTELKFQKPSDPSKYIPKVDCARMPSTGGRVWVSRPTWDEWEFDFIITVTAEDVVDKETLKNVLDLAGRIKHVGTYRAKFGMFEVVEFEEITEEQAKKFRKMFEA